MHRFIEKQSARLLNDETNVAGDLACLIDARIRYIKSRTCVYNRFSFCFALRSVHTILGYRYKRKNDNKWRLTNNSVRTCSSDSLHALDTRLLPSSRFYRFRFLVFIYLFFFRFLFLCFSVPLVFPCVCIGTNT